MGDEEGGTWVLIKPFARDRVLPRVLPQATPNHNFQNMWQLSQSGQTQSIPKLDYSTKLKIADLQPCDTLLQGQ